MVSLRCCINAKFFILMSLFRMGDNYRTKRAKPS